MASVKVTLEKIDKDFATPIKEETKQEIGYQNSKELCESLNTFRMFEHPYDGQFVPKVYLDNGKTIYVVVAEGQSLSCSNLNDPNHALLHVSPAEVVGVVFGEDYEEEAKPETVATEIEETNGILSRLPYWFFPSIVVFNCGAFLIALAYSWQIWSEQAEASKYQYTSIADATDQEILERRAKGVFVFGTLAGDELIVLSRRKKADFYIFKYSNEYNGVVPIRVESRPFEYTKLNGEFALKLEGQAPIQVPSSDAIIFDNKKFNRYKGDFKDFF